MSTEERIKKLGNVFVSMRIANSEGQDTIFVRVDFKPSWFIDETTDEKYNVSHGYLDEGLFFWCDLETGMSTLLDAIEFNVEQNKIEEAKSDLFSVKMKELEDIFKNQEYTLDDLENITFEVGRKRKTRKKPKAKIDSDEISHKIEENIDKSASEIDLDNLNEEFIKKQKEKGVESDIFSIKNLVPPSDMEKVRLWKDKDKGKDTISLEDAVMLTDLQKTVEKGCSKAVNDAVADIKERQETGKIEGEIKGGVKIKYL